MLQQPHLRASDTLSSSLIILHYWLCQARCHIRLLAGRRHEAAQVTSRPEWPDLAEQQNWRLAVSLWFLPLMFFQELASKVLSVRQVVSLMEVDCAKVRRAGVAAAHHVARAEEDVVDEDDAVGSEALPRDGHAAVAARAAPQRLQRSVAHLGQKLYPVLALRPRQPPCNTASSVGLITIDSNISLASVAMDCELFVLLPLTILLTTVSSA